MRTTFALSLACLALTIPAAPALAYAPNGHEWTSMGQCNSYLKRWAMASARGEKWHEVARFEAAYCVPTEWGTFIAVFPF